MSHGQRWTFGTFDIDQCFTVVLHCWSILFSTFMMSQVNVAFDNDDVKAYVT